MTCHTPCDSASAAEAVFEALASRPRREILTYCETACERSICTTDELSSYLARQLPSRSETELAVELRHKHLPKLDTLGWLEFDSRSDTVRYHGHGDVVEVLENTADVFRE